ncbi:hypothetical protein KAJ26_06345, partial [bacterium]|nr:hypothetical protein [bacterium]
QYSISQDINEADYLNYTDPVVLSEYDYGEYYVKARGYDNIGNVSQIVDAILFIVPNVEVETDNCEPLNILVYSDADCSELEQVLIGSKEIWKVDIADTASIFDEKLRSGLFNGMILLNGKNMKGTVSGKVSEYVYWGNPVVNFGFTGLGDFFQELTGVKEFGKLEESIYSFNVIPSAISPGFDYLFDGKPLELLSFSSESSVSGTLEPGSSPAVIQNIHGRGRSLFFNHPIIPLPSDLSDMIVSMLETYNFPEYDPGDNFPSRIIPVEYVVSNDSSETVSVKLDISSVDIAFLDISEGDIINNSTVQYFDLSPYSDKSISVMIQLPELKGDYTIESDLSLKCGGIYSLIDSTVDRYDISFTIDELYAAILLDLEEMSQVLSGNELSIVNEIYAEMEAMRENIGNFDSAMNNLLTQIKALRSIGSYDIS